MLKNLTKAILKIKAFYKRFALILGIVLPICLYAFMPGVSVFTTPLSFFGITQKTQTLWIVFNQLMAIALLMFGLKANENLAEHPQNKKRKKILEILLVVSVMAFALSGMITMDIHIPHLTLAGIFFLVYVGYIFWYGYFSKHKTISLSLWSILIVVLNLIAIGLTFYFGISYGFFEIVFIFTVVFWNFLMIKYKKV